jgi:uncharacterized membrane protein
MKDSSIDAAGLLQAVPLFGCLDRGSLGRIAAALGEQRLEAGQILFSEGDAGDVLYLVVDGEIEIFIGHGTHEHRLRSLGPGSHLGELALLDGAPRSASARATARTRLLLVPRDLVLEEVLSSPAAARAMLAEAGRRLRGATSIVGEHVARNAVKEFERKLTFAERQAERIAMFNGSWTAFLAVLVVSAAWMFGNSLGSSGFDPYPYQLFNLLLAIAIALQGPMLMMSQNRQAQRDRAQAAADYEVNLKNELGIQALRAGMARIEERLDRLQEGRGP